MVRAFLQRVDGRNAREAWLEEGRLREAPVQRALLDSVVPTRVRMKDAFGVVLRWAARLLWLSPAFVVAALIARAADRPLWSSVVAVAFAIVVVAFFGALAAFILASVVAHPVTHLVQTRLLPPWEVAPAAAPALSGMPRPGTRVRVRGRIERIAPAVGPLVRDFWAEPGWRATTVADAVVRPADGVPVVLCARRAPLVLAERSSGTFDAPEVGGLLTQAGVDTDARGELLTVEDGAEVEVDGTVLRIAANAQHVELDGERVDVAPGGDDPYRQGPGGPAIVLGDPIALRVL